MMSLRSTLSDQQTVEFHWQRGHGLSKIPTSEKNNISRISDINYKYYKPLSQSATAPKKELPDQQHGEATPTYAKGTSPWALHLPVRESRQGNPEPYPNGRV